MKRLELLTNQIGQPNQDFTYSVPTGPKKKGETQIYRKPSHSKGIATIPSSFPSLASFWDSSVKNYPNNLYLEDLTFKKVDDLSKRVGSWIRSRGHKLFFLYCLNSVNWTITDIASWNYGLINVPLYDTLGPEAFNHILKITEGTLLFTTKNLIANLVNFLKKNKYNLKEVCVFDEISAEERKNLQSLGITVSNISEGLTFDKISERPKLNLDTELTYAFTSGTTGIPKGVIYTHRMAISQVLAMEDHLQIRSNDVIMSYLPIAHSFQRFVTWICTYKGANIRYAKHPITEILKDFAIIKPTFIPIVPRLLNKFYPLLKGLSDKEGNFDKVKAVFGGRLRCFVTGSAPVAPAILKFFSDALGADAREGYGQTESTAGSFVTYKGDSNYGHVGGPNSCTQFKLVDVPEMNYLSTDKLPRGEVCMRGPSIFTKYFKDPKNTAETVDSQGWNHSGDIGMILPNGSLKIIDRKKNIFKLQQGQYIAPEKVENIYARCKFVAESFLYGDSMRDYSIAIIHPNLEALPAIAKNLGIEQTNIEKLCQNSKITQFIFSQINKQGKADGLLGFELAKKICLWHQPFQTVGIVTSTMKLQRHLAKQKFKKQIENLYK